MPPVFRAIAAAAAAALMGALALVAAYARDPGLTFEMDAPLPAYVTGIHGSERDGETSFAWTRDRVSVDLRRLDRRSPWSCSLRFRGPRPEGSPAPTVDVLVDDARVAGAGASAEFHDLGFTIPAGQRGLRLQLNIAPTFTPGTADTRMLGVQIDRLQCRPAGLALPPAWPLVQTTFAAAFVGGMLVLLGFSLGAAILCAAVVAVGAGALLVTGGAIYSNYSNTVANLAVWITLLTGIVISMVQRAAGRTFSAAARWVFAISAVALIVKLIALLHPAKPVIDAMFHAHRLDDVIGGRRLFSQPFVGGVEMPYAIGLYVFAWPWAWVTENHMALVRAVTAIADVLAGALLYPVLVRAWADRKSAALAVLFYQLAPLGYAVLGNANLTNLFGQSAALGAMAAAMTWNLSLRRVVVLLAFAAVVALPFLSHVSTITTLIATLGLLVVLYWWRGDAARKSAAYGMAAAVAIALAISWFVFYRHFGGEIAAAFARMFSGGASGEAAATAAEAARGFMGTGDRLRDLVSQAVSSVGKPMVLLAAIGVWAIWRRGVRDRVVSGLFAWAGVWFVFSVSTVFSPVDPEFVRYAAELLGRINLATIPMVAILAARGASAGWDESVSLPEQVRRPLRAASVILIGWSGWIAWNSLLGWFSR